LDKTIKLFINQLFSSFDETTNSKAHSLGFGKLTDQEFSKSITTQAEGISKVKPSHL
jgi:hypothetical protein